MNLVALHNLAAVQTIRSLRTCSPGAFLSFQSPARRVKAGAERDLTAVSCVGRAGVSRPSHEPRGPMSKTEKTESDFARKIQ